MLQLLLTIVVLFACFWSETLTAESTTSAETPNTIAPPITANAEAPQKDCRFYDSQTGLRILTDFPGAAIGTVEKQGPGCYRMAVPRQFDERKINSQSTWFAFGISDCQEELTLIFHDFNSVYNGKPSKPSWSGQRVVVSGADRDDWEYLPQSDCVWSDANRTLTVTIKPTGSRIHMAYTDMYTNQHLKRLIQDVGSSSRVQRETIGHSLDGRPLERFTVTDFSVPADQKTAFYIMARQHAWEANTSWQADAIIRRLADGDRDSNRAITQQAVFYIVPMVDPDGAENGTVRFNGNGFDVNRRWNEVDVLSPNAEFDRMKRLRPEVWFVKKDILDQNAKRRLAVVVNLHNDCTTDYIDAAGDPDRDWPRFREFDRLFAESVFYDPNPKHPLTILSSESAAVPTTFDLWWNHKIPVLMIEQKVMENQKTKRNPLRKDSAGRGEALLETLLKVFCP